MTIPKRSVRRRNTSTCRRRKKSRRKVTDEDDDTWVFFYPCDNDGSSPSGSTPTGSVLSQAMGTDVDTSAMEAMANDLLQQVALQWQSQSALMDRLGI